MLSYIWPIALVVLSNIMYHICAKSSPAEMNPFASLTITYLVGGVASFILFKILTPKAHLLSEYSKTNWAPFVLGLVIIGLEAGNIYTYKAGWKISTASIVQNAFLAVALLFVGVFAFGESLTWNKIVGMVICLVGLFVINLK